MIQGARIDLPQSRRRRDLQARRQPAGGATQDRRTDGSHLSALAPDGLVETHDPDLIAEIRGQIQAAIHWNWRDTDPSVRSRS